MPRIAILGCNGFLGTQIVKAFEEADWEVIAFSRNIKSGFTREEFLTDLFDEDSLKSALLAARPEVVLSAAWDTEHGKFWTNTDNVKYRDATLRFAELCFELGIKTFVGLGTMSEYGNSPGYCNADYSPLIGNDIYSSSKIETGLRLKQIGERFGGQTYWTRIFQAFGPSEKQDRFIPGLIANLRSGKQFSIRTPNFEMDWIHSADVASAMVFTLENNLSHFVDIGTGIGTSVKDLSELICEELGLDSTLLDFSGQIPGHEKKAVVDQNSQLLVNGWKPVESLRNRIKSLN